MRSIISTSIANVIRFGAEGTQMLIQRLPAQRLCVKSCAPCLPCGLLSLGSTLRRLATANTGVNPAYLGNANFALNSGLNPFAVPSGNWGASNDERGIDAIDHQRPLQVRSQRDS